MEILFTAKNLIELLVTDDAVGISVRMSYFYSPPYCNEKPIFWESVRNLCHDVSQPWCCIGDFNELVWPQEKWGGATWCPTRVRYLRDFMENNSLMDVGFSGAQFTWAKKDNGEVVIQERLHRGLVNATWLESWPNTMVSHCPRMGSDRCPIILNFSPTVKNVKPRFRFESFWTENSECHDVVNLAWNMRSGVSGISRWNSCLRNCKRDLKKWSTIRFPNNHKLIHQLMQVLETAQNQSPPCLEAEKTICDHLSEAWNNEEAYWKQRPHINWLKGGDADSRFFHLSTTQRRRKNRVLRLEDDNGVIVERENEIRNLFEIYYEELFTSSGCSISWGNSLDHVNHVVTEEMNFELCKP